MKGMDLIMKKLKEKLKYGKRGITLIALVITIIGLVKFDSSKENNKWMAIVGICVGAFDFILVAIYSVLRTSMMLL